ncbi:MAG: VCBS repeat-containing protein [Cyclobacteriaceae bacterium]
MKYLSLLLLLVSSYLYAQEAPFVMRYDMGRGEPRLTFGTEKLRTASISTGDIDGDGDIDAVVANGRHWPEANQIFFNEKGKFSSYSVLGSIHSTSYAAELADMDNDGDLDIIEVNDTAPHRLYLNNGKGQFSFHSTLAWVSSARNGILSDIDGNGFTDVLICNRGEQNILCYNDGDLGFECTSLATAKNATIDIEVADINGDDLPDLVLANRDGIANTLLLNRGDKKFEEVLTFGQGTYETRSIEVADMNNDGYQDIITANINGKNLVYLGSQDLQFKETISFGEKDEDSYSVAKADFNQDGYMDVIVGNYQTRNAIFINQGGKSFDRIDVLNDAYKTYDVKAADLNDDGWVDVVFANSDAYNLYMLNKFGDLEK